MKTALQIQALWIVEGNVIAFGLVLQQNIKVSDLPLGHDRGVHLVVGLEGGCRERRDVGGGR